MRTGSGSVPVTLIASQVTSADPASCEGTSAHTNVSFIRWLTVSSKLSRWVSRLPAAELVEVELLLLVPDRLPREVRARRGAQLVQPRRCPARREHERVAVEPWPARALLEDARRHLACGRRLVPRAVRDVGAEHDEPRLRLVGNLRRPAGRPVHACELAALLRREQPLADLVVGVLLEEPGLRAVGGRAADRLPERVPVLPVVLDEVGGSVREPPQRVAEHRGRLARLDAAELDRPVVDPLVRLVQRRRRPHVDRARHPARRADTGRGSRFSRSSCSGSAFSPSTSAAITGVHPSSRYRVSSACTGPASIGTDAGMIISDASPRSHSSWMTAAISRSTPRVRWNFSSVDQSSNSLSNSSGWIG